jgi:hypothetical protein
MPSERSPLRRAAELRLVVANECVCYGRGRLSKLVITWRRD